MKFGLNHMTVPNLCYADCLDLAARLGCFGIEVRNDLARPLFDTIARLAALVAGGYDGPISFECFAPDVHALSDPYSAIKTSLDLIKAHMPTATA